MSIMAQQALAQARLMLCEVCPEKQHRFGVDVCGKCGCLIAAKARLSNSACPMGKWPKP